MRNFFYRISSAMARFMYGRSGTDQLNMALLVVYLAIWIAQLFLARFQPRFQAARAVLEAISLIIGVIVIFRMFSKSIAKRRAENAKFLSWWHPVRSRFAAAHRRRLDKEHKYFTCKSCKTLCRVPAGKGKVEITCPKCGQKIIGRS